MVMKQFKLNILILILIIVLRFNEAREVSAFLLPVLKNFNVGM